MPAGFKRVGEGADGNCFFHAIARQALGDTKLCARARSDICDWMDVHLPPSAHASGQSDLAEHHRLMIMEQREEVLELGRHGDDAKVRSYVAVMRRSGKWGTGIEALCGAYVYGRPVHVYSPDGFSALEPPPSKAHGSGEPIRLLHNGRNHWDSLFPLEASAGDSARPEPASKPAMMMRNGVLQPRTAVEDVGGGGAAAQAPELLFGSSTKSPELAEERPAESPLDDAAAQRRARAAAAEARMMQASSRGLGAAAKAKGKAKAKAKGKAKAVLKKPAKK